MIFFSILIRDLNSTAFFNLVIVFLSFNLSIFKSIIVQILLKNLVEIKFCPNTVKMTKKRLFFDLLITLKIPYKTDDLIVKM